MKNEYSRKSFERVAVFLDGNNFYHRLRDSELNFRNLLQFDYRKFAEWLAQGRKIVRLTYYIGLVRRDPAHSKSDRLVSDQQRLFAYLEKQGWQIERGYMMKVDKTYKEKGVDVRIALDLLYFGFKNQYDTAILVSSDTDLTPAIERVKELGKGVEHVGFSHRPSFAMQRHATVSRLLTKFDLEQFLPKKQ